MVQLSEATDPHDQWPARRAHDRLPQQQRTPETPRLARWTRLASRYSRDGDDRQGYRGSGSSGGNGREHHTAAPVKTGRWRR
jgi:hypothetical protein